MTAGILAVLGPLIAALAPVLANWIVRRWAAKSDPKNILEARRNENAQAVVQDDADELNRLLDDRIARVRPAQTKDSSAVR